MRDLAKWRSQLLANTLALRDGQIIRHGPFAGMDYAVPAGEGAAVPRMLGVYEHALAPVIETIISTAYPLVINLGCAEGYYAVGLARRMPETRILAQDTNPTAQDHCRALAHLNGVAARVVVGGTFTTADFAIAQQQATVVICDIEGAEAHLLDPDQAPGLLQADILVEVHEVFSPGLTERITARFAASHTITRIDRALSAAALPAWMETLSDLDRLLALWEWRAGPTPWLWMTRNG